MSKSVSWLAQTRLMWIFLLVLAAPPPRLRATAQITSSSIVSVSYADYTVDYMAITKTGGITWYDGSTLCPQMGTGWVFGGVYSPSGNSAAAGLANVNTFMSAHVPNYYPALTTNQYIWASGRKQGIVLSTNTAAVGVIGCSSTSTTSYCNYNAGEPNNATSCTDKNIHQNKLIIYSTSAGNPGSWDDMYADMCGVLLDYNLLCERSACNINADCVTANSNGVSGYFPLCTCICKTGFGGPRCQVNTTSFTEDGREFVGECHMTPLNASVSQSLCRARGVEWSLASITSETIANRTAAMTNSYAWTGGTYSASLGGHYWQYGRYAGKQFSQGIYPAAVSCYGGMYCKWKANQPDHTSCFQGESGSEVDITILSTGEMNDLWSNGCGGNAGSWDYCYICERSLCVVSDCPPRTSHVSGYFPNCACQTETQSSTQTSVSTLSMSVTESVIVTVSSTIKSTGTVSFSSTSTPLFTVSVSSSHTPSHPTPSHTSILTRTSTDSAGSISASSTLSHTSTLSTTATDSLVTTASRLLSITLSSTASTSLVGSSTQRDSATQSVRLTVTVSVPGTTSSTSSLPASTQSDAPTHTASLEGSVSSTPKSSSPSFSGPPTTTPSIPSTSSPTHPCTASITPSTSRPLTASVSDIRTVSAGSETSTHRETRSRNPTATSTALATVSPAPTPSKTHAHTPSATYAPNVTLIRYMLQKWPLFGEIIVKESDVRNGFESATNVSAWDLFELLHASQMSTNSTVPVLMAKPLVLSGVTGNAEGFFAVVPEIRLQLQSSENLTISLSSQVSYSISVDEGLELYTTLRGLIGRDAELVPSVDPDALLLVGRLRSTAGDDGGSLPSVVIAVAGGVGGAAAAMGAELQGLGALAMMECADPNTKSNFGSYRVLSPVAVINSYSGVVIGNLVLVAFVFVVQVVVVGVLRVCRRVSRRIDLMSTARFPSLLVYASLAFHTGTAYASSQLISRPNDYAAWEVFIGVLGSAYTVILPAFFMAHPYLRLGRAYQEYELGEWLLQRRLPPWTLKIVPLGAIFSKETRQAYGGYISAFRAPPKQVWWNSMITWTSLVFFVGGLVHPMTVPGCQALFASMGILLVMMGMFILRSAPLRSHAAGWLDAASRFALAGILFSAAAALVSGGPTPAVTLTVNLALAVVLVVLTATRVAHHALCYYFDMIMLADEVALVTLWTHIPGATRKVTHQFSADGDGLLELQIISAERDEEVSELNTSSSSSSVEKKHSDATFMESKKTSSDSNLFTSSNLHSSAETVTSSHSTTTATSSVTDLSSLEETPSLEDFEGEGGESSSASSSFQSRSSSDAFDDNVL